MGSRPGCATRSTWARALCSAWCSRRHRGDDEGCCGTEAKRLRALTTLSHHPYSAVCVVAKHAQRRLRRARERVQKRATEVVLLRLTCGCGRWCGSPHLCELQVRVENVAR